MIECVQFLDLTIPLCIFEKESGKGRASAPTQKKKRHCWPEYEQGLGGILETNHGMAKPSNKLHRLQPPRVSKRATKDIK